TADPTPHSPPPEPQRMLVMHSLLGNPQPPGDIPPRPALGPGVIDLHLLQHLDQPAQRHHRSEASLPIRPSGSANQPSRLPPPDNTPPNLRARPARNKILRRPPVGRGARPRPRVRGLLPPPPGPRPVAPPRGHPFSPPRPPPPRQRPPPPQQGQPRPRRPAA